MSMIIISAIHASTTTKLLFEEILTRLSSNSLSHYTSCLAISLFFVLILIIDEVIKHIPINLGTNYSLRVRHSLYRGGNNDAMNNLSGHVRSVSYCERVMKKASGLQL